MWRLPNRAWAAILVAKFARDCRATVAVLTALFISVLMGVAAIAVDVGKAFTDRRKAQGTVDLAALAAVNDLPNAERAAMATVRSNKHGADTSVQVQLGIYTPDPGVSPGKRFVPSGLASANAARVTLRTSTPLMFGRAVYQEDSFAIRTTAIATQAAFAEFAIGSRLLKIDSGLLNQVLGGLLGTKLALSVMDYEALVRADIDLFDFMNATAVRARLAGPTYDSVLKGNVWLDIAARGMVDAARSAYGAHHAAARALDDVAQSVKGRTDRIGLRALLDLGPYAGLPLGQKPKMAVGASALDLLTAMAQIANGRHQIELTLNADVPGIAGASLKLLIGERPAKLSWVAVGSPGASVHTAQTRLLLTVQLAGQGSIAGLKVPILLDLGSASAKLNAVACGASNVAASTVTLGVEPSVVNAWIGDVANDEFRNLSRDPNPPATLLVNTPGLRVRGRAHVTVSNVSAQPVTFSYSDIVQRTKKTVSARDFAGAAVSRLIKDASLNAEVVGVGIGLPQAVTSQVAQLLGNAAAPMDRLVSGVLAAFGVGAGQADVWVPGVRCDGAVLVN